MKVYNFDDNGWFVGEQDAHSDPEESRIAGKTIHLLPAKATFDEPPTAPDGQRARFVDGAWVLQEDPAVTDAKFIVFFRKGADAKILGGAPLSQSLDQQGNPIFRGQPLDASTDSVVLTSKPDGWPFNSSGIQTKQIVSGAVADRDPARIAADPANRAAIAAAATQNMNDHYKTIVGKEFDIQEHNATVGALMYVAQNIDGSQTAKDIAAAKKQLATLINGFSAVKADLADRDAKIAALDPA